MTSPHLLWLLAGVGTILVVASIIGEILRLRLSPAGDNPVIENLNARINAQVGAEDRELCERVQMGMSSYGYEPGPLSNYEHAVVDFHDRIRAVCPVVNDEQAPVSGTVRRRNDALLMEQRSAA